MEKNSVFDVPLLNIRNFSRVMRDFGIEKISCKHQALNITFLDGKNYNDFNPSIFLDNLVYFDKGVLSIGLDSNSEPCNKIISLYEIRKNIGPIKFLDLLIKTIKDIYNRFYPGSDFAEIFNYEISNGILKFPLEQDGEINHYELDSNLYELSHGNNLKRYLVGNTYVDYYSDSSEIPSYHDIMFKGHIVLSFDYTGDPSFDNYHFNGPYVMSGDIDPSLYHHPPHHEALHADFIHSTYKKTLPVIRIDPNFVDDFGNTLLINYAPRKKYISGVNKDNVPEDIVIKSRIGYGSNFKELKKSTYKKRENKHKRFIDEINHLVENGADISIRNKNNMDALMLSMKFDFEEMFNYLSRMDADSDYSLLHYSQEDLDLMKSYELYSDSLEAKAYLIAKESQLNIDEIGIEPIKKRMRVF